jgi:hypothetical protein
MLETQTRAVLYLFQLECDNTVASSPREGQQLRRFDLQNLTWNNPTKSATWFVRNSNPWPTLGSKLLILSGGGANSFEIRATRFHASDG